MVNNTRWLGNKIIPKSASSFSYGRKNQTDKILLVVHAKMQRTENEKGLNRPG
jgi:hypothetical protein